MKPSDRIKRMLGHKAMMYGTNALIGMTVAEAIARKNSDILNALIQMLDEDYQKEQDSGYANR